MLHKGLLKLHNLGKSDTKHFARGVTFCLMRKPTVRCSPDLLGGTPIFAGTRVPVQTLIEYLEGGDTIDDFLEGFPTVTRQQVVAFLEEAKDRVVAAAS